MLFLMRLAQLLTCGLILMTNVPMIIFTMNQKTKTLLDWLIGIVIYRLLWSKYTYTAEKS